MRKKNFSFVISFYAKDSDKLKYQFDTECCISLGSSLDRFTHTKNILHNLKRCMLEVMLLLLEKIVYFDKMITL